MLRLHDADDEQEMMNKIRIGISTQHAGDAACCVSTRSI